MPGKKPAPCCGKTKRTRGFRPWVSAQSIPAVLAAGLPRLGTACFGLCANSLLSFRGGWTGARQPGQLSLVNSVEQPAGLGWAVSFFAASLAAPFLGALGAEALAQGQPEYDVSSAGGQRPAPAARAGSRRCASDGKAGCRRRPMTRR